MSSEDVMMDLPLVVAPEVILQQPIKVQTLKLFKGTKEKVEVFIMQLQLCFEFQPVQFRIETSKILYAVSYLCKAAVEWFLRYLKD